MIRPVTRKRIEIAERFGLKNVDAAAETCRQADLPFWAACALLEKESGGRNIYGHDIGGALSGFPGEVNRGNFEVFHWLVFDQGRTSNGVGPCQITWRAFFREMEDRGLKPWVVRDNMLFGFELLMKLYEQHGSWQAAGGAYNGADDYGQDFVKKCNEWRERLEITGEKVR